MPYNLTYYAYSIFTATCASGEGIRVTAEGSAESIISQRDADRKAEDFARTLAISRLNCLFPPAPDEIRYFSEAVTASSVCSAGSADPIGPFDPSKVLSVSLPAGAVYSTVSVEDANAAAQVRAQIELLALLAQRCEVYYSNTEQSATADCQFPFTGSSYTATVAPGVVTSFISLEVANNLAQAAAVAAAQAGLSCVEGILNTAQTATVTCALYDTGTKKGPYVSVTTPPGVIARATLEEANAVAYTNAYDQALLSLPSVCIYDYANVARTATITCDALYQGLNFGAGASVTVPENQYFSNVSQPAADDAACAAAWAEALTQMDCFCPSGCVENVPPLTPSCLP